MQSPSHEMLQVQREQAGAARGCGQRVGAGGWGILCGAMKVSWDLRQWSHSSVNVLKVHLKMVRMVSFTS